MFDLKKELKIRARLKTIYNQEEQDFDTKEQWDDYLEHVEDIVSNLAEGIDVQETESKISKYQRANQSKIASVAARKAEALRHEADKASKAAAPAAPAPSTGPAEDRPSAGYTAAVNLPAQHAVPVLLQAAEGQQPMTAAAWAEMAAASGWKDSFVTDRFRLAAFGPCNLLPGPVTVV
ncbi:hypothetical protein WJX73_009735 [Symbiochloris irregularis]|uniref:MAT1 centre domain-containing protein n=1 Tax=Symbiochloris irregularis TaxID=706552 RepID=A0AAW1PC11_9CHLO